MILLQKNDVSYHIYIYMIYDNRGNNIYLIMLYIYHTNMIPYMVLYNDIKYIRLNSISTHTYYIKV